MTLTLADKNRLLTLVAGDGDSDGLRVDGDPAVLASLIAVLDRPDPGFNIITP